MALAAPHVASGDAPSNRHALFVAPRASERRAKALEWLLARSRSERVLVVGASSEAAKDLVRAAVKEGAPAGFGWQRISWGLLASTLSARQMAERGLVPIGGLSLEALCARLLHQSFRADHPASSESKKAASASDAEKSGELIFDPALPGAARALARTLGELRNGDVAPGALEQSQPVLARLLAAFEEALLRERFADRAEMIRLATAAVRAGESEWCGRPILLLDVQIASAREEQLLRALGLRAELFAVAPEGDSSSIDRLAAALACAAERSRAAASTPLLRLQQSLFATGGTAPLESAAQSGIHAGPAQSATREDSASGPASGLELFSAPGEGRECVEIARRILGAAARGVPFDRMAVVLRSPSLYRPLLEEALARAQIPAWFSRGTRTPDPSGRAFLSLLACAEEGLSARRFAEYLSLGELPLLQSAPASAEWVPPGAGEELLAGAVERAALRDDAGRADAANAEHTANAQDAATATIAEPHGARTVENRRSIWRWEPLIIDAAVIGGREVLGAKERWKRRLEGHRKELLLREQAVASEDEARALSLRREREDLDALWTFAEPLLERLSALPTAATWGEWLDALDALAIASLRDPLQLRALLAQLRPLGPVGPVTLAEVQLLLARELGELSLPPPAHREGKIFVGSIEAVRGLSFAQVFVPGLAERLFPPKALQDPLLRDRARGELDPLHARLPEEKERVAQERLQLRLCAGAAEEQLVLSWPRLELQLGRARVPSFYALEALAAAEGALPGFVELSRRAERAGDARAGWPAPRDPAAAIDEAEHDLSLLADALSRSEEETRGVGRYLLGANSALRRALYRRAARPRRPWRAWDGLVDPLPAAIEALRPQQLDARSFSASALQKYAACPYQFFLSAIHKLEPREEPEPIDQIDPLSRGSLMHDVQFKLFEALREEGALPLYDPSPHVAAERLRHAQEKLSETLELIAREYQDRLAPAIARVWDDGIASIRGDLREWLRRVSLEPRWAPAEFERAFGLIDRGPRDSHSQKAPALLAGGLQLRGSIDLVERASDGALRATDYKSGRRRAEPGIVIKGGEVLQPVLYALALEQLFPGAKVEGGQLFYCTHAGEFTEVPVPLDDHARAAELLLARTVGDALRDGFFPAAPRAGECARCDYLEVCGEGEEARAAKKSQDRLVPLHALRGSP